MLGGLGGSGVLLGAEHRPGVVLSLLWVVAFDHRQVDAGVVPDPPGCPQQDGAGLSIMRGRGAGEPFQGGRHDVGPARLGGQAEGLPQILNRAVCLSEVVIGISQAAAGVGDTNLGVKLLGRRPGPAGGWTWLGADLLGTGQ